MYSLYNTTLTSTVGTVSLASYYFLCLHLLLISLSKPKKKTPTHHLIRRRSPEESRGLHPDGDPRVPYLLSEVARPTPEVDVHLGPAALQVVQLLVAQVLGQGAQLLGLRRLLLLAQGGLEEPLPAGPEADVAHAQDRAGHDLGVRVAQVGHRTLLLVEDLGLPVEELLLLLLLVALVVEDRLDQATEVEAVHAFGVAELDLQEPAVGVFR